MKTTFLAAGMMLAVLPSMASAQRVQSGTRNGISYTATSRIIGQTPTASGTVGVGGGDAIYFPSAARQAGTAALIMEYSNGDRFICSGTLASDRRSIITAAHCVSGGAGTANPVRTTAYFFNGDPDQRVPFNPNATAIDVSDYFVNPNYTGEVIDQNDIAVLRLANNAPAFAQAFDLYTPGDLTGTDFTVAGYGGRSTVGGALGNNAQTGWLREGDNTYDYAWGNAAFDGFFTERDASGENFFGRAEIEFSYVSDFDNGRAGNDTAGLIAEAVGAGSIFNDTGRGDREANIAGGDSGGPGFVNGQLASVNSYGLSFGVDFGDINDDLDSSWGEFSGYVPTYIHADFINGSLFAGVPEPTTWALMILGFGAVGGAMRRRQTKASVRFA